MAWTAISGTIPQYQTSSGALASGYYLKFYSAGTSTAINMATDSAGGTTLAKCQINSSGYPINGSGDPFIPHIDQTYKLILYKNATDADNNTTANADWEIDNIAQYQSGEGTIDSANVTYTPAGSGAVATVVQEVLRRTVHVKDYGALGDNAANDYTAINNAIVYVNGLGGGIVHFGTGGTYKTNTNILVLDDVTLELNGATIRQTLTGTGGADYGLKLRNRSKIRNGTVSTESSGTVGSQTGIHSAINVGPLYGDGGTVASPSADNNLSGWVIENVTAKTDRTNKAAVQIYGNCSGLIDNLEIPDSAVMTGLHLDWGSLGNIDTTDSEISATRGLFDAGAALTTHPNNITIRNLRVGELTLPVTATNRAHGIRLSGVHNIDVVGGFINKSAYAGFYHTAGDAGYEFASADDKRVAHMGIRVRGLHVEDAQTGWGCYINCDADNVRRARDTYSYVPLLEPIARCDIEVEQLYTNSDSGAGANDGIRIEKIKGGTIRRCNARRHQFGILVEESAENVDIIECNPEENRKDDIFVGHSSNFPFRCRVIRCKPKKGGTDGGYGAAAGIYFSGATECEAIQNMTGDEVSETSLTYGIRVSDTCTGIKLRDNHVRDIKTGGLAYNLGSSTSYDNLDTFDSNTYDTSKILTTEYWAGPNIVPIAKTISMSTASAGNKIGIYRAQRAAMTSSDTTPPAGTWNEGDIIYFDDGPSGTPSVAIGSICTAGGSPGTWRQLTSMTSLGVTGGSGSAGATNTYVEVDIAGTTYKLLTRP